MNFVANTQGSEPVGDSVLLLVDLGRGKNRLGGSILAQVVSQMGEAPPDVDSAADLKNFWNAIQQLGREKKLLAYHDRSDGGLLATAVEMAFAGHVGVDLELPTTDVQQPTSIDLFAALFTEELGAVIQVRAADLEAGARRLRQHALEDCTRASARLNRDYAFASGSSGRVLLDENLSDAPRHLVRRHPAHRRPARQSRLRRVGVPAQARPRRPRHHADHHF